MSDNTVSVAKNNRAFLDQIACQRLKGVGPQLAVRLQKCGINTLQDLLFHLPLRYQDRTKIALIKELQVGDTAQVQGQVINTLVRFNPRRSLLCHLQDASGVITLRFFHFNASQKAKLEQGGVITVFGEVRGFGHQLEMIHPEYRHLNDEQPQAMTETLTPVYPSTSGLSQKILNTLTEQALHLLNQGALLHEYLPASILAELQLPDLRAALNYVHRPPPEAELEQLAAGLHPMQQRLAFEELLAHHLSLLQLRNSIQIHGAPQLTPKHDLTVKFCQQLPFQLTQAQQRVAGEIARDLAQRKPALRLIQGDVGSGKTAVAALAALQAIENNYQVALMAPTEILAEQHFQNFQRWFEPLNIPTTWLGGKHKGKARQKILEELASGQARMIIGTHALFQDTIQFKELGLVIIDEQHRFGVQQRLNLRDKGFNEGLYPHQLIMSATPIPRSLAMIAYADLDHSIIDELPPGRTPIVTSVLAEHRRFEVMERIKGLVQEGRQVYWICTLIEESENLQCQAAEVTAQELHQALPELTVGLVHGRLSAHDKQAIMAEFRAGNIDLLVATTVIEVGVDVPNASLMVIENAERLGLAQIHQLRGRVGRGAHASHCVLLYQAPLSFLAKERLKVLRNSSNGFEIAQRDLELRGPGEVLGTRQAGNLQFKIAELNRDKVLLAKIQRAAVTLQTVCPEHIPLIIQRWLGINDRYAEV